jgi:hypothetical protein
MVSPALWSEGWEVAAQLNPRNDFFRFFVQNPQQNQLCELLNMYMKSGVPKSKSSYINTEYSDEALNALYGLPQSWRDFVNACDITEIDTKIQSAIWELVSTEVDYIYAIQTVTDVSIEYHFKMFSSLPSR